MPCKAEMIKINGNFNILENRILSYLNAEMRVQEEIDPFRTRAQAINHSARWNILTAARSVTRILPEIKTDSILKLQGFY